MNDTVTLEIAVPANHPSLAGHFPGQPVVPAVVLLDAVLAQIRTRGDFALRSIPVAKFLHPVLPEERVELRLWFSTVDATQMRVRFQGSRATTVVVEGSFILSAASKP
jgi:3-hydroxymyristoyl/3-hydroxydecanoyl-(acyl carrier protein) dehydratase